jgi:hypothetical protein
MGNELERITPMYTKQGGEAVQIWTCIQGLTCFIDRVTDCPE